MLSPVTISLHLFKYSNITSLYSIFIINVIIILNNILQLFLNTHEIILKKNIFTYKIYIGHHIPKEATLFNLILPIKHYFEENDIIIIFKEYYEHATRVIDNSRNFF